MGLIRTTYYVVLVVKGPDGFRIVKKKKMKPVNRTWKYEKNKKYVLDWSLALPMKRKKAFLYIDAATGSVANFEGKPPFTPEELNILIPTELAREALKEAVTSNMGLIMMALCVAVGLGIGIVIGQNFLSSPKVIVPAGGS